MKHLQRLKDFIWNDLPLRLSTLLVAIIGVIMVYFVIMLTLSGLSASGDFRWQENISGFFFFYCFICLPVIGIFMILFLIECIFKKLRLNFSFFKLSFYKCVVLIFYVIAIFPVFPTFFPYLFGFD